MARPSKIDAITDEQMAKVVELVEAGDKPQDAFGVVGLSRATYFRWLSLAREGVEPHASFETRVTCAVARFKSRARATILSGDSAGVGFGPAKAHLEVLSRRFPKDWAQRLKHELEDAERLMFQAVERVCASPDVLKRVCESQDLGVVLVAVCEELARLDGEEAPPEHQGESAAFH